MAANKLTNFTKVLHKTDRASEVLVFDGNGNTSSIKPEDLVIGTATKLESPVTVTLTGDVEGTFNFDGSEINAVSSNVTVNDNSHAHIISNVLGLQDELDTLELNKLDKTTFNATEVKSRYESNADTNAFTDAYKTKLTNIESGAEVNTVNTVSGYTGSVVLDKVDIGLPNVSNDVQLKRDSNLSDIPNASTARTNLGLAQVASTGNFSDMSGEVIEGQLSSSLVSKINDTLPYNVNATTPPTVTDDSSAGWKEGSLWVDNTSNEAYRCVDSSVGAAVWINTTLTTEELSTVAVSGSYNDLLNKPSNATTTTSGFMSPSDKAKLNGIESGAEANVDTNLSSSAAASSYSIGSSTGTGTTLNSATQTLSGVLSASDKTKLDNIESNAQVNTVDSVNSKTGSVILSTDDVSEGASNQYFTTTRARNSISVSGDLTYNSGVISFNETYSTPSEVKTAYESNTNTNAYTDSEKTKLSGIEAGAEVNDVEEAPINGNQYARQDGVWSVVSTQTLVSTDDLSEGTTNLYYTDARASSASPVQSVAGKTGSVSLVSSDVGLGSVRNVSSYSQLEADNLLNGKLDTTAKAADSDKLDGKEFGSNVGDVMAVGDFGIGRTALVDASTDTYSSAGLFRSDDRDVGLPYQQQVSVLNLPYVPSRQSQIAVSISSDQIFWRTQRTSGAWGDVFELYHTGNDGPGSGLDADTIDGYQAQDFAYPNQPSVTSVSLTGDFA